MNSKTRVVFVSTEPEAVLTAVASCWKKQFSSVIAERDHHPDLGYMSSLTRLITLMQKVRVGYSEESDSFEFLVAHPYEIYAGIWHERQIVVCCDEVSAAACLKLMNFAKSDFRLMVVYEADLNLLKPKIKELDIKKVEEARVEYRRLLRNQVEICSRLGIDVIEFSKHGPSAIKIKDALKDPRNETMLAEFRAGQAEIADMRVVCGRAKAHRHFSAETLRGLQVVSSYLAVSIVSSDHMLFDDPGDLYWRANQIS